MVVNVSAPEQSKLVDAVIEQHRKQLHPVEITHSGHKFTLLPGIFSPFLAPSGYIGLSFSSLPIFKEKRVLEVGSGSGIISCLIALSGAKEIVGVDINPHAIDNARLNARHLCVDSKASFRYGNLFKPIHAWENFDIIFADLPFTSGTPKDMLEAAFFDPELDSINSYIKQLPQWLKTDESRAYLCLSNLDGQNIQYIAQEQGLNWHTLFVVNLGWIELYLIELSRERL